MASVYTRKPAVAGQNIQIAMGYLEKDRDRLERQETVGCVCSLHQAAAVSCS